MNNLPKYWVVKNDGSKLFKDTVMKYLKDNHEGTFKGNSINSYYGINSEEEEDCSNDLKDFYSNPTELTIKEFITLTK